MAITYNDPNTVASDIGATQMNTFYYEKKALIEAAKTQFFGQLADVQSMPKNMGKKIKRYHYIPMLDIANLNDQGIDAAGAVILNTERYATFPAGTLTIADAAAVAATAEINDDMDATYVAASAGAAGSGGAGLTLITLNTSKGLTFKYSTSVKTDAIVARNFGVTVQQGSGNLYGSSKDIGVINGRMPTLSEAGGRVNRVGFKRKEIEGTLEKFGFFDEYSQESMDFDSDADLEQHITREMIMAANELTEDTLQVDLITSAGVVKYSGVATSRVTVNSGAGNELSYGTLMRISIDLDNNRTPKQTKVITGSRMVDTKTVMGARIAYIGSELLPTLKAMKDLHNNAAWIPVQQYADAGNTVNGEEGAIDALRFVVVPEMVKYAGAGADAAANTTHYKTNNRLDVFPILIVGDESFTTIGFQTDGKTVKFKITHKKPGEAVADRNDPYGELGFMSIKWYYGFMALRPERIGLVLTAAAL